VKIFHISLTNFMSFSLVLKTAFNASRLKIVRFARADTSIIKKIVLKRALKIVIHVL
jgi:hypothetical protein